MDVLEKLRSSDFNNATTAALESHPFFQAAEGGTLTKDQLRSFVQEQYFIQQADLLSLTHLASRSKAEGKTACNKMFDMLAGGEKIAQNMLLDMAKWLGLSRQDLDSYQCQMLAQVCAIITITVVPADPQQCRIQIALSNDWGDSFWPT